MEAADFDPFSNKPNISSSSRKLYTHNLTKLNGGKPIKDFKFLSKSDEVLQHLEGLKPNTRRTYLISIVSALKDRPESKYKKLYSKFYDPLDKLNKTLKNNTEKTEKVKENWMEQSEVNEKLEDLGKIIPAIKDKKKISPEEYGDLLKLVVLSLYTLQAPRRNKDYVDMLVVKKVGEDTTHNYLDATKWEWVFNNYKTKGTYKTQTIPVPDQIKSILEVYFKFHPKAKDLKKKAADPVAFLVYSDGEPVKTSTEMTRLLNRIFGKSVGCSLLRSIYLTDKYGKASEELKKDAAAMATSTETAQNNYIKSD
jgi:hypothetical protein